MAATVVIVFFVCLFVSLVVAVAAVVSVAVVVFVDVAAVCSVAIFVAASAAVFGIPSPDVAETVGFDAPAVDVA